MKIQRQKVSEQIVIRLKAMIKDGTFPPNSKLPSENQLSKTLGVSRTPLREALSVMAASGLIESRQGGGSWVRKVDITNLMEKVALEMVTVDQVFELLELRTILETEAAALAAQRHTEEDLLRIESSLEEFYKVVENDGEVGGEADYGFHRAIVIASHNSILLETLDNISGLYRKCLNFTLKQNIGYQRKREKVYNEHKAIYLAIKSRHSDAARERMTEHLQNVKTKLSGFSSQEDTVS